MVLKWIVFAFLVCTSLTYVLSQAPCTSPNYIEGTCIDVRQCKFISDLIKKKNKTSTLIEFLRNSECGRDGPTKIKVCCEPEVPPQVYDMPILLSNRAGTDELFPPDDQCGTEEIGLGNRINFGEEANVDQFPWMGLMQYNTATNDIVHVCGAALISKRYVVTAGHCVRGIVLTVIGTPVSVRLGEHDLRTEVDCVMSQGKEVCNEVAVVVPIETIIPHPEYKPALTSQRHDIALIRLASEVTFTTFIRPICLPKSDITKAKAVELVAAGWGQTETGRNSDTKRFVYLPIVALPSCQASYIAPKINIPIEDKQICAGGVGSKDSCKGDSGGPLMGQRDSQWNLDGIVSFGPQPCGRSIPGVYTKVFSYVQWIANEMKP